jgi:hypothetical protein
VGVAIACVEAAREAADYRFGRGAYFIDFFVGVHDGLGLLFVSRSVEFSGVLGVNERAYDLGTRADGLFAEDVQASLNCFDGLFGVHGGSAGDDYGL